MASLSFRWTLSNVGLIYDPRLNTKIVTSHFNMCKRQNLCTKNWRVLKLWHYVCRRNKNRSDFSHKHISHLWTNKKATLCTGNMQYVLWHDFLCLSQPRIANSGLGPRYVSHSVFFIAGMSNQLFMLWTTSCLRSQSAPPASHHFETQNWRSYRGVQLQVLKEHNFSARVLQEDWHLWKAQGPSIWIWFWFCSEQFCV